MPVLVVAVALLGLAVGSFLNVVVHRVPTGASLVAPGSHCPQCEHPVRARHNVPVLGWLWLRGACADCRGHISIRYPLVELVTAVVFVALVLRAGMTDALAALPAQLVFAALGLALALIDLDTHRLPDVLVLPAYPVLAVLLGAAAVWQGDLGAFGRAAVGAAALYVLYHAVALAKPGGMGFGDVKLAGIVGAVLGYSSWSALVVGGFAAFLLGGVTGVVLLATHRADRRSGVPFGPFMVAGALVALLAAAPIAQAYLRLVYRTA